MNIVSDFVVASPIVKMNVKMVGPVVSLIVIGGVLGPVKRSGKVLQYGMAYQ